VAQFFREFFAAPLVGYNAAMKLQFSLATLLVCMTAVAIEAGLSFGLRVHQYAFDRPPNSSEVIWRLALLWPLAIVTPLGALWLLRRLKSRRHTEPPVG